jgi:hypothetical protein
VRADGWRNRHFFVIIVVPFLVLRNSKLPFSKPFSYLYTSVKVEVTLRPTTSHNNFI